MAEIDILLERYSQEVQSVILKAIKRLRKLIDFADDELSIIVTSWADGDYQVEVRHGFIEDGNISIYIILYKRSRGRYDNLSKIIPDA